MTSIERLEIKGITVRIMLAMILSTAGIVGSVMTTYFNLKDDIRDVREHQQTTDKINDIKIKILEANVSTLNQELADIKKTKN